MIVIIYGLILQRDHTLFLISWRQWKELKEVQISRDLLLSKRYKALENASILKENSKLMIREDIVYEENTGIWYLKINSRLNERKIPQYTIMASIEAIKDDYLIVKIYSSTKFHKNEIILVKVEAVKEISMDVFKKDIRRKLGLEN